MPDDWLDGTCNAGMGSDSMKVDNTNRAWY